MHSPVFLDEKVEVYATLDQLCWDAARERVGFGPFGLAILERITPAEAPRRFKIARVTWGDLGFETSPTFAKSVARARELGLGCLPAWVGPMLFFSRKFRWGHYQDGHPGDEEVYLLAMEPVVGDDEVPLVFRLHRGCEPTLHAHRVDDAWVIPDDYYILFLIEGDE